MWCGFITTKIRVEQVSVSNRIAAASGEENMDAVDTAIVLVAIHANGTICRSSYGNGADLLAVSYAVFINITEKSERIITPSPANSGAVYLMVESFRNAIEFVDVVLIGRNGCGVDTRRIEPYFEFQFPNTFQNKCILIAIVLALPDGVSDYGI